MDLMLNAVEDDASGGESSPSTQPPAFSMPVSRISARSGASLSSILSAASPQTPNDAPRFELPVARHAGLASLMNSPRDEEHGTGGRGRGSDADQRETETRQENDVEMREPVGDEAAEEAEEGEEMEEDTTENDESPAKRRRGYSVASEGSVSTPPSSMAPSVQSPASVALNADALVLEDPELVELKAELQAAIQKYLSATAKANAPPPKRRKGKQQQKKKVSQADATAAMDESLEAVEQCITKVHEKITVDLMEVAVLRDVVRICVMFLGIVIEVDAVYNPASPDVKTTLETLQQKPVHIQLASTIRRVMLSVPEDALPLVLGDVFEWILNSGTNGATWCWLFAFFAQFDSSAIVDFLVQHTVFQQSSAHRDQEMQVALLMLDCVAVNRSAEIVEAVRNVLQRIAASSDSTDMPVSDALTRLVSLGLRSSTVLHAIDTSFQWIFTKDLVLALWAKCAGGNKPTVNGAGEQQSQDSIYFKLLQLIDERSVELDNSIFQSVLLLQQLSEASTSSTPIDIARIAGDFHADVVRIAQQQSGLAILQCIYRRIPFITQSCVELLVKDQHSPAQVSKASPYESWKTWLIVIGAGISRQDITNRLVQADLTLYEVSVSSEVTSVPVKAFCKLLCTIVDPSSPDFAVMLRELAVWLRSLVVSSSGRYRLLSVLERLVDASTNHLASELKFIRLQHDSLHESSEIETIVYAFSQMSTCATSWSQLERWRAASGAELWEYLLDLIANHDNAELSSRALFLLAKTPFPSLEDPLWQFRCVRKLSNVYFYFLRHYRASLIDLEASLGVQREWRKQLETIHLIVDRVCREDGAVAHYSSSVCSQFTSLWLDLLFSSASATSVPTHFPSSTKGGNLIVKKVSSTSRDRRDASSPSDDQVVIRSERTISSKCTNLQSSQVITKHSDTLVYRKALDETWERELEAAFTCSLLATNVLEQQLTVQVPDIDAEKCERRLKVLVDMLLERATPCCGVPSDDVYKDILPNRCSFDVDLRIEQWLNHFPSFLPLLRLVIDHSVAVPSSTQSLRVVPVVKSALVVLVGHWNSVKGELDVENMDVPPYMRNRNQLALSCELLRILRASGWIPEPLARTAELLPLTTPADIRAILFSCWFFLADHPPTVDQTQSFTNGNGSSTKSPTEFYVLPVRKALHRNIHKIGAKYAAFMP